MNKFPPGALWALILHVWPEAGCMDCGLRQTLHLPRMVPKPLGSKDPRRRVGWP